MSNATDRDVHDKTRLQQLNEQYIEALMKADVNWYQQHLADDFVCIEYDGSVLDKDAFLRRTQRGSDVSEYKLENVNVRIYGETALVQATGLWTRKDGSTGMSRYTDVYVRSGDDWKVVSAQITRPQTQAQAAR
jgi:ketosteroid isomerase-like protein